MIFYTILHYMYALLCYTILLCNIILDLVYYTILHYTILYYISILFCTTHVIVEFVPQLLAFHQSEASKSVGL